MATWKESFGDLPISTKFNITQTIALIVLFTAAIIGLTSWLARITIRDQTGTVRQINRQTLNMIQVYNNSLETHAAQVCGVPQKSLPSGYTPDTAERIVVAGTPTPVLKAGGETLNGNFTGIDNFSELNGAVVTGEVRKLAGHASSSTREISPLIQCILDGANHAAASMEEGVRQASAGVSYAGQAGGSIASIRQSASQVTHTLRRHVSRFII